MAKTSKAVRRGIYFSEEDSDLLDFIDSQEVSASKFVTQIIREKKEGRLGGPLSGEDLSNRQLLQELKSFIETKSFVAGTPQMQNNFNHIQSSDEISYGGSFSNALSVMDEF